MAKLPPWIRQPPKIFQEYESETRGNGQVNRERYGSAAWRKASAAYFRGKGCSHPGCPVLAELTDHIIPIGQGGAQWDRRNWQPMCKKHHDRKRGREAHGHVEEYVETEHGRIPARNAHLPPDIANTSYLIK